MKLEKAIEILLDIELRTPHIRPQHEREALELGIEALKRVRSQRYPKYPLLHSLLPGETEE